MGLREKIEKLRRQKEKELQETQAKLVEIKAFLEGLEATLKLVPRDGDTNTSSHELRPGSLLSKTRDLIIKAGRPMHIKEILEALNKPATKKSRTSLAGSLSGYVRRGEVFIRPAPNTFGLRQMNSQEPPSGFGGMDEEDSEQED